ncbi:MAG: gliding motility-associated C-terminal domain-containing protein, partial [Hymenobacteraceae bacterium]|nr:gliding motility-associated C-terminal domain-containing protein [Hymenobacteraceae bacterium]
TVLGWHVRRDGVELLLLPAGARSYADAGAVGCPRPLCYEVMAEVRPAGSATATETLFAFSSDSCARTPGALPLAPRLTASFDLANNLVLRARLGAGAIATGFQFTETRAPDPSAAVGTSDTPVLTIVAPDTARVRGTCYTATLTDTCAQQSLASANACPSVLRGRRNLTTPAGPAVELLWTPYVGFPVTATYTVELLDDQTNAVVRSALVRPPGFAFIESLLGNQRQLLRYRIRVEVPGDTTRLVYSNFVDLGEEQFVRLPTAFTPNGDNLNDTFVPVGRYELREVEMTIYDRWGRELYHTTTPGQGWDGRPRDGGDIVPPGVFAYRFRGRDALGHAFTQKGTVTVLR